MHVWDAVLHVHLHTFRGHKDTITVSGTQGTGVVVEAKCSIWYSINCSRGGGEAYYMCQNLRVDMNIFNLHSCDTLVHDDLNECN